MFKTERLEFRQFTPEDLPLLIEQRSDPEVNRYLGGTKLQNPDALARRLEFYIGCYEKYGFGTCAMLWKQTGEMIGSAGIQPLAETDEIEVGYSIIKNFWGRGIGTEAAYGWLDFGFTDAGLDRIVAVADEENIASRRVMEKCGMRFERNAFHYERQVVLYAITRGEFLALRDSYKGFGRRESDF